MGAHRPTRPDLAELKRAYVRGENITRMLRESSGKTINEQEAILIAYDLQAGSYVANLEKPEARRHLDVYSAELAALLCELEPRSLLEAGVGEATTLRATVTAMGDAAPSEIFGFDLSWSRIHVARRHWAETDAPPAKFFVGELEAIPLPDDSVDVVFTSHAVEPNHGREREILAELYRVCRRHLVLLEPGYELASPEARARMDAHGYCRGLADIARENGWRIRAHRLFGTSSNPLNPTALFHIEKPGAEPAPRAAEFLCPNCRAPLANLDGHWFCGAEGIVFPVLREIPCLLRSQAILASHFAS